MYSPWSNSSCPMRSGPVCSICNYHQCSGSYTGQAIPTCNYGGPWPCLECHIIDLNDGTQVCGIHLAGRTNNSASCFCGSGQDGLVNCRDENGVIQERGSRIPVDTINICAPWGLDIITRQCVTGQGSCTLASLDDCRNGMAIAPTQCTDVAECGGELCGPPTGPVGERRLQAF